MTTVTRTGGMTLGQVKRLAAICVDMIPVDHLSKFQARALIEGGLKGKFEKFWNSEALSGLRITHFFGVTPRNDIRFLEDVIENRADFYPCEFYFPEGFTPQKVDVVSLPINYKSTIRDLYQDIQNPGCRTATPEEALGVLSDKNNLSSFSQTDRRIIVLTDDRFGSDLMVIEFSRHRDKPRLLREKRQREDLLSGEYSVLVVSDVENK